MSQTMIHESETTGTCYSEHREHHIQVLLRWYARWEKTTENCVIWFIQELTRYIPVTTKTQLSGNVSVCTPLHLTPHMQWIRRLLTRMPTVSESISSWWATCRARASPTAPLRPPQVITIPSCQDRPYPVCRRIGLKMAITRPLQNRIQYTLSPHHMSLWQTREIYILIPI